MLADNGHGRPLRGNPDITRIIQAYRTEMQAQQERRGVVIDMQRIPTPQPVFNFLLQLGFSPLVSDGDLQLVGLFVLLRLSWLRADSLTGFQLGDVVLATPALPSPRRRDAHQQGPPRLGRPVGHQQNR